MIFKLAAKLHLYQKIITGENETDLVIEEFGEKGRGIRAKRYFEKGEFVIEYKGRLIIQFFEITIIFIGDIISDGKAKCREKYYAADPDIGSYMYYFIHKGAKWCVDATEESPYKGRLINHSFFTPNLKTKVVDFGEKGFHLCLFALRDIKKGEELLYDYGDRSAKSLNENPWLMTS